VDADHSDLREVRVLLHDLVSDAAERPADIFFIEY